MGCWISHRNEQENTEGEIDAHHHRIARVRMCRIQYATDARVNGPSLRWNDLLTRWRIRS